MNTGIKMAAVSVIALIGFSAPAVADELGNKIARELCAGTDTQYRLSAKEEAAWNEAHLGSYSEPGLALTCTFSKSAGTSTGQCSRRKLLPFENAKANVTKSGSTLNRMDYSRSRQGAP